jgi:hypothetical protein
MVDIGDLDTSNSMHMECLWFSFNKISENELSQVQSNWNNHYIPNHGWDSKQTVLFARRDWIRRLETI